MWLWEWTEWNPREEHANSTKKWKWAQKLLLASCEATVLHTKSEILIRLKCFGWIFCTSLDCSFTTLVCTYKIIIDVHCVYGLWRVSLGFVCNGVLRNFVFWLKAKVSHLYTSHWMHRTMWGLDSGWSRTLFFILGPFIHRALCLDDCGLNKDAFWIFYIARGYRGGPGLFCCACSLCICVGLFGESKNIQLKWVWETKLCSNCKVK